jgi:methionine-S-sulfoxide reductase
MTPLNLPLSIVIGFILLGCQSSEAEARDSTNSKKASASQPAPSQERKAEKLDPKKGSYAIFAGGCFWCTESAFEKQEGVIAAVSGYTGGKSKRPTYGDVSAGQTDHVEAVLVTYDPKKTNYDKLLDGFWRSINPTQSDGQFADRGPQYITVIYYLNDAQKTSAESSKQKLAASKKFSAPIATQIIAAGPFWRAEENHQDYYKKHPLKYRRYFIGSGRKGFLEKTWGPDKEKVKTKKSPQ